MLGREHSRKVSKKFIGNFYFWGITLTRTYRYLKVVLEPIPYTSKLHVHQYSFYLYTQWVLIFSKQNEGSVTQQFWQVQAFTTVSGHMLSQQPATRCGPMGIQHTPFGYISRLPTGREYWLLNIKLSTVSCVQFALPLNGFFLIL